MGSSQNLKRYSDAFQRKIVSEIEMGKYTILQARKIYDITGKGTVERWLRKQGKNELIGKIIRIEMKNESDKLKELEREKQKLESALAQAHLKILCLESTIEVANDYYQTDLKKNFDTKLLPKFGNKRN